MPTWDNYVNQYERENEGFDLAQICKNGHLINDFARTEPHNNKNYCDQCGKSTITACPSCKCAIKGYNHASNVGMKLPIPSYYNNCGHPYPWTTIKIEVAKELANELDLNDSDKITFSENFESILHDSPKTILAANRIKNVLSKASKSVPEAFYKLLVDVISETAKKILFSYT